MRRCRPLHKDRIRHDILFSQSTNDAYPTALTIALIRTCDGLISVLSELIRAFRRKGVYELVLEKKLLSRKDLDRLLVPEAMVRPHRVGRGRRSRPLRE